MAEYDEALDDAESQICEAQRALRAAECEARACGRNDAADRLKQASRECDRARSLLYPDEGGPR